MVSPVVARRRRRAFSLLELVAVVVVIGVLGAISVPRFQRALSDSAVEADQATLAAVARQAAAIAALDDRYVTRDDVAVAVADCDSCQQAAAVAGTFAGDPWQVVGHDDGTGPAVDPAVPDGTAAGTYGWILGAGWGSSDVHLVMASREAGRYVHARTVDRANISAWDDTVATPTGAAPDGSGGPSPDPGPQIVVTETDLAYSGTPGGTGGLFWHLGTRADTQAFENPAAAAAGFVDDKVTSGNPQPLTDRNTASNWFNNDVGYHTAIDWDLGPGQQLTVDRWEIRTTGTTSRRPSGVRWQGSNDGTTWETVYEVTGQPLWPTSTWVTDTVSGASAYRHVRLQIPHTSCGCGAVDLAEVELYGTLRTETTSPAPNLTFDRLGGTGGLFWHLGTDGGTGPYVNPAGAASGLVDDQATSTETIHYSWKATDRDTTTRWSGNCTTGAILAWDLGPYRTLRPTRYEMTSSSGDSPLLRTWALEGSHDGVTWAMVKHHQNDTSIAYPGDKAGWWLDDSDGWRHLRVRHIGPSSAIASCTSIFEIEFYGHLATSPVEPAVNLAYRHLGGEGGLFWHIGTAGGTQAFQTPTAPTTGWVDAKASTTEAGHWTHQATDRNTGTRWSGNCTTGATLQWDLGPDRRVNPNRYEITSNSADAPLLRHWAVEGSLNGTDWTTLRLHSADTSIAHPGDKAGWWLPSTGTWRFLRVRHIGPSAGTQASHAACTSIFEIEFYGTVVEAPSPLNHAFVNLGGNGGLFWTAGTAAGTQPYANPAPTQIPVWASHTESSHFPQNATDRNGTTRWSGNCTTGARIRWDLGASPMEVHRYELASRSGDSPLLRNWVLEGSNDATAWTVIREHQNDISIEYPGDRAGWWVSPTGPWRYLQVRHVGPSSVIASCTSIFEVEFYGNR